MGTDTRKFNRQRNDLRRALRRPFESAAYLLLKWTVPFLPRRALMSFSQAAGKLALRMPVRERKDAFINLNAVFGDSKTDEEKKEIFVTSIATFVMTMLDVFWFSRNSEERITTFVQFEDTPNAESFFENKAMICITAHMGSWEIIGQAAALKGADLASIAAPVKNRTVDRILIELREKTGQTIIPRKGALKLLIARLRKNGKTAFVLDQNTDPSEGGIWVDFLGLPMSVSPAPAGLAYRTGTPVYFGFCIPQPDGNYSIQITEMLEPPPYDKERDTDQVAKELTQVIENHISDQIRKYPQFWLWSYRHWRRHASGQFPANYPAY